MSKTMMRLKIGDGLVKDISTWGLELIKSPDNFGGKIKDNNIITTDFPELDGEVVYMPPEPKQEAFDYTVTFAFHSENEKPSVKINAFVKELIGKKVVVYNDYKGVQIEGRFKEYKDGEFYKNTKVVVFEVIFRVSEPNKTIYY